VDRRFLRPGWIAGHVLVFLAVLTCLRLGWWQWGRTHETTGTAQNFGYALLWPAFGAAFVYMWVRFLHLEVLKDAEDDEETDRDLRALLDAEGVSPDRASQDRTSPDRTPPDRASPDRTSPDQGADTVHGPAVAGSDGEPTTAEPGQTDEPAPTVRPRRRDLQRPSRSVTLSVAMVGEDDDDDPELTAYNQALAALAEEDRRRAR